ncbi:GntR family transcriptional regulator [Actinopolymorpha alba]|uniref:GntR family transcriptional regulator n=1 Tax=Actinopolymorpha alba TaxID=533267 RepID=UPI0003A22C9C|nr:GntR family transcriptional regulator [Actinopolymorpha alba]
MTFLVVPEGQAPSLPLERPISRGDRVRDALLEAILNGTLQQGTALVERELSTMLGVSKTPIREALKQLQSSGLVVLNAYQGMSVRTLDAATVRDVTVARAAVEPTAIRLAVEQRPPGPHPAARQALSEAQALLRADQPAQLGLKNRQFHRELYVACDNPLLVDFLDKIQVLNTFIATAGWRAQATYDTEGLEHAAILDAFERGDAGRAEQLMREHITRSSSALLRNLDSGE